MKVSYFPGCTLKTKAKDLDLYARKSALALGVTLEEIENWQCCGGVFTTAKDEIATKLSSVRALAEAKAKGETVSAASADLPYSYMMISSQTDVASDNNSYSYSYVLACASTDFASDAALDRKYGNASVLAYACNTMGSLVVPVSLDCKYYASMEITGITAQAATRLTVIFATVPACAIFIAGIYVMVRRKHA